MPFRIIQLRGKITQETLARGSREGFVPYDGIKCIAQLLDEIGITDCILGFPP